MYAWVLYKSPSCGPRGGQSNPEQEPSLCWCWAVPESCWEALHRKMVLQELKALSYPCLLHSYLKNNFCATITYSIMFSFTSAAVSCSVSFAVVLTYLLCASRFYVGPFGKTLKVSNVYNFPRNTKLQLLCVLILLSTSSIQTIFSASKARDGLEALNQCCSVAMRCSYLPANMFVPNSI